MARPASRDSRSAARLGRDPEDAGGVPSILVGSAEGDCHSLVSHQQVIELVDQAGVVDMAIRRMARAHLATGAVSSQRVDRIVGLVVAEEKVSCRSSSEAMAHSRGLVDRWAVQSRFGMRHSAEGMPVVAVVERVLSPSALSRS